jgi:hypothetical protein
MSALKVLAVIYLAAGAVTAGPAPFALAATAPTAVAETDAVSVGQRVRVHGDGWGPDASQVVSVVLCGNAALDGAADCDLSDTAEGGIRDGGTFYTLFTVPAPTLPCPCLLRVFSPASAVDVRIPVSVLGAATRPPQPRVFARRAVRIDSVHLEGDGPWASWFGAAPRRQLVYRVTNTGEVTLHDPPVDIVWGKGPNPSGFVGVPAVGDLPVNATRTFTVPIRFPALSFGSYRAVVKVDPFGEVGAGGSSTSLTPWGLIAVAVAGPSLLLALRLQARRSPVSAGRRSDARSIRSRRTDRASEPALPAAVPALAHARLSAPPRVPSPARASAPARVSAPAPTSVPSSVPSPGPVSVAPPVPASIPVAGWYTDPLAEADLRLWDGTEWTDATKAAGPQRGGITEPRPVSAPLALVLEDSP